MLFKKLSITYTCQLLTDKDIWYAEEPSRNEQKHILKQVFIVGITPIEKAFTFRKIRNQIAGEGWPLYSTFQATFRSR